MTKTLAEYLHIPKEGSAAQPVHKAYYLDDVLEKNPTQYCPNCDSTKIKRLHTHNVDGVDYGCQTCRGTYELMHYTKREEFAH